MSFDSNRIAKNTFFLYVRLLLVLGVTLFTSRVVLDKLGVEDYALYNVIYGIVGLVSFLNGTLSIGTSRFITYDLGKGEKDTLKETFGTAMIAHLLLGLFFVLLGETAGLWYVNNVMVCPPERLPAANVVYQISIIVTFISIVQVPFTSDVIAHEEMGVYAYIGIFEALSNLVIIWLLKTSALDKLILYASLVLILKIIVLSIYVTYVLSHYDEASLRARCRKDKMFSLLKFSGWNILANISESLMSQGVVMLFNIFFLPVVVTARSISNQLSAGLMQFVSNVRNAVNPQVIKLYADSDFAESKRLTLMSAEYIFYLLLLLGVPCIMVMPFILDLWLVDVPEYAVTFARLIIVQNILSNFSAAFYTPMIAANKIKGNSIMAIILCAVQFGTLFALFKLGMEPVWSCYLGIIFAIIWSLAVKPFFLWRDIDYEWKEIFGCVFNCLKVLLPIIACSLCIYILIPQDTAFKSILVLFLSLFVVSSILLLGMGKTMRGKILNMCRNLVARK